MRSAHLVLVRIHGRVSHRATKASLRSSCSHRAFGIGVLSRQAEVEHEHRAARRRQPAHGEVRRLDITMEKADRVDRLDGLQNLQADSQRGGEIEALARLTSTQFG